MSRTGVRKVRADAVPAAELSGLSQAERISVLRSRMGTLERPEVLGVGPELAKVLPGGGLARRAVTHLSDCPALVIELIAHCTAAGGHVGVVGWSELSYAGVPDSGGELDRIITVPEPGPEALSISAVLVEGLDLVVHHFPVPVELSPTRARPLLAKLRGGTAALVLVGAQVPAPAAVIDAKVSTYRGVGTGYGRINGLDIRLRVRARGRPPQQLILTLGNRPRLRAV
ncbi:hypothetical protein [Corynebacterium sp. A21]|uniref:hypothetical protein n=1 Tax=Corynebacterium sp. A21 TaxID=3457318 RepID=UPI003FD1117F